MNSSPTDLAYAAGVVDSDGCIGIHRNTYAMRVRGDAKAPVYMPRVTVKQVTPQAIDLLHELFGGHRLVGKPTAAKGRPLVSWNVHSAAAGRVCQALLPYLRIKKAQAENAIDLCRINSAPRRYTWVVPGVIEGEPLVTMTEAAERIGKSYATIRQAVDHGSVPFVRYPRNGRKPSVFIPESYLPVWMARGSHPSRRPDILEQLEYCFLRAKELNRVGV